MYKSNQEQADEIFKILNSKINRLLTDDEIKYVHWLARSNDQQWQTVLLKLLNDIGTEN